MIAAIPFFGLSKFTIPLPVLGNLELDPWAILVCLGFVIGLEISRARAVKLGLEPRDVIDGAVVTVGTGFLVGHLFTVAFYFPERLWGADPQGLMDRLAFFRTDGIWALLRFWEGFSSMGGFLGAIIGSVAFYGLIRKRSYWRFADIISFGFPFGWFFGRVGCGVVHDHVGSLTRFPLGMNFDEGLYIWQPDGGGAINVRYYEGQEVHTTASSLLDSLGATLTTGDPARWADGVRHELGLYEAAFMIPIMILWVWLGRKDRVPGFFTCLFALLYLPVRFGLDFLRNVDLANQDLRWVGLTPAQWGCVILFIVAAAFLATRPWKTFAPWALDYQPDQARRASGVKTEGDSSAETGGVVESESEE